MKESEDLRLECSPVYETITPFTEALEEVVSEAPAFTTPYETRMGLPVALVYVVPKAREAVTFCHVCPTPMAHEPFASILTCPTTSFHADDESWVLAQTAGSAPHAAVPKVTAAQPSARMEIVPAPNAAQERNFRKKDSMVGKKPEEKGNYTPTSFDTASILASMRAFIFAAPLRRTSSTNSGSFLSDS